ncbi:DUF4044 domain-containing protein [Aciduricibacillus chroicocephali]
MSGQKTSKKNKRVKLVVYIMIFAMLIMTFSTGLALIL